MAKILIASIGIGVFDPRNETANYRNANYYVNGDTSCIHSTPYVIEAIKKFYEIDKLILIGTCGSGWLPFYSYLYEPTSLIPAQTEYDLDYAIELEDLYNSENKFNRDPLEIRKALEPLKQALGDFCMDVIVLKYGLNEEEHLTNFGILSAIGGLLQDGDKIYFDITHSYRSLPVYELLSISYFKDVLNKDIKVEAVTYGMLEASKELDGKTPIVNMEKLVHLLDYIQAVEEYRTSGTAYKLKTILDRTDTIHLTREERRAFAALNDTISCNDIQGFRSLVNRCHRVANYTGMERRSDEARILFDYIFSDIDKRFYEPSEDDILLQIELAKWHFEKKRYIASAVTIIEAIISYSIMICSSNSMDSTVRKEFRNRLLYTNASGNDIVAQFLTCYNDLLRIRNELVHPGEKVDTKRQISELKRLIPLFVHIYKNHYKNSQEKNNSQNQEDLRKKLLAARIH